MLAYGWGRWAISQKLIMIQNKEVKLLARDIFLFSVRVSVCVCEPLFFTS